MTSLIAACGSGRSTSFIPAVPAAWSVTTIAFIAHSSRVVCRHLPNCFADEQKYFRIALRTSKNTTAKLDGPMTFGYGIDAMDAARENQGRGTNIRCSRRKGALEGDDFEMAAGALPQGSVSTSCSK